jgi:hypothetical protein
MDKHSEPGFPEPGGSGGSFFYQLVFHAFQYRRKKEKRKGLSIEEPIFLCENIKKDLFILQKIDVLLKKVC